MHVESIISKMDKQHSLSKRTQKGIIEILNPIFKYALKNKMMEENPIEFMSVKVGSQKKIVTNAGALFHKVYTGVNEYYHDNPYYRALFLFAFTGRRKSEILKMKWENIDFNNNYYWIEETKNADTQLFPLPEFIKTPLLEIKSNRAGYVFESPIILGKPLKDITRQMNQLKKHIGVDNLTLHYMRNILVSALAEQSTEAITLSGILGHKDINTINKYLSNSTMKSGLKGLETIDNILDVEVME
jgi:integrase